MSLTPDQEKKNPQSVERVMRCIDMQVQRDCDFVRARHYWEQTLDETPRDVLIEALSLTLATGRYQVVPRCRCGKPG